MESKIKARVEREIFKGDGGFTIALIKAENEFEPMSAKGIMEIEVGEEYYFNGEIK